MTQPTHGGPRQGVPGRAYPNRTDLNVNRAPAAGQSTATPGEQPRPRMARPDDTPSISTPSIDNRPVTEGLPIGPGAGPEALTAGPDLNTDRTLMMLQVLYEETGSPFLLRLINQAEGIRVLGNMR